MPVHRHLDRHLETYFLFLGNAILLLKESPRGFWGVLNQSLESYYNNEDPNESVRWTLYQTKAEF